MIGFVKRLFGRQMVEPIVQQPKLIGPAEPPPLKVWAVKDYQNHIWNKVVVAQTPVTIQKHDLIGPFRSEVDCEEFCDRNNKANHGRIGLYNQSQQQEQHGEAES